MLLLLLLLLLLFREAAQRVQHVRRGHCGEQICSQESKSSIEFGKIKSRPITKQAGGNNAKEKVFSDSSSFPFFQHRSHYCISKQTITLHIFQSVRQTQDFSFVVGDSSFLLPTAVFAMTTTLFPSRADRKQQPAANTKNLVS